MFLDLYPKVSLYILFVAGLVLLFKPAIIDKLLRKHLTIQRNFWKGTNIEWLTNTNFEDYKRDKTFNINAARFMIIIFLVLILITYANLFEL